MNAFTGPEIAAAVRNLLAEPGEASRIGKAGRAWVVANHNADSIAERIEARAIADPR